MNALMLLLETTPTTWPDVAMCAILAAVACFIVWASTR